ncbi:MAG: hypothetical protein AB3N17_19790 [Tateyamaria sp.]
MTRSITAIGTALALVIGLATSAAATTVSFPPDISIPDDNGGKTQGDRGSKGTFKN